MSHLFLIGKKDRLIEFFIKTARECTQEYPEKLKFRQSHSN